MKHIRKETRLRKPEITFCLNCDKEVKRGERICSVCGRLLTRNRNKTGWKEIMEMQPEPEDKQPDGLKGSIFFGDVMTEDEMSVY